MDERQEQRNLLQQLHENKRENEHLRALLCMVAPRNENHPSL